MAIPGNEITRLTAARPQATVRPASVEEVVAAVRQADGPLLIVGSGSALGRGVPLDAGVTVLDTTGLDQVVEYEPADLTLTVQAGAPLATIEAMVQERGQTTGLVANGPDGTIGGTLATAAWGGASLAFGRVRDRVIGLEWVDGSGTVAHSGGRVVKNVSGYDVAKLQIGALGTLGVLTQVSLKLSPLAPKVVRWTAPLGAQPPSQDMVGPVPGRVLVTWSGASGWTLEGWLDRTAPWEPESEELTGQADVVPVPGAGSWDRLAPGDRPGVCLEVLSTPLALLGLAADLALAREAALFPWLGAARLWVEPGEAGAMLQLLRGRVEPEGRVVLAGFDGSRPAVDPWGLQPEPFDLMLAMKDVFDPERRLNPGRGWGGL